MAPRSAIFQPISWSASKPSYATVELTDGANLAGMRNDRASCARNAPAVEGAIQNLEDDSLSSDPDMNTEIAVLNKINAANVIAVRNTPGHQQAAGRPGRRADHRRQT